MPGGFKVTRAVCLSYRSLRSRAGSILLQGARLSAGTQNLHPEFTLTATLAGGYILEVQRALWGEWGFYTHAAKGRHVQGN